MVLVVEGGMRFAGYAPADSPYGYRPDLLGDYLPDKEHIEYLYTRDFRIIAPYKFYTNSEGLRADKEVSRTKRPGLQRILIAGDSFVLGPYLDNHETLSALLEESLSEGGDRDIEVVNSGFAGWTITDEYQYLMEKGLKLNPDVVLLFATWSDIADLRMSKRTVSSRQRYVELSESPLFGAQMWLRRRSAVYFALRDLKNKYTLARSLEQETAVGSVGDDIGQSS